MRNLLTRWTKKKRVTVQESIPLEQIVDDGVFRYGNVYSVSFALSDVNYTNTSEENQTNIIWAYEDVLKAMSSTDNLQIVLINKRINEKVLDETINIPLKGDSLDNLREELNKQNNDRALRGENKITREIVAVISSRFASFEEAKPWAKRYRNIFPALFNKTGSTCRFMTTTDRLKVLHHFYRPEHDDYFDIDTELIRKRWETVNDYLAPMSMKFEWDRFRIGSRWGRSLLVRNFSETMEDYFISSLMDIPKEMIVTINLSAMEKQEAVRIVNRRRDDVNSDISKRTRSAARMGNWNKTVEPHLQKQIDENDYSLECLEEGQKYIATEITIVHMADASDYDEASSELETDTKTIKTVGSTSDCNIEVLQYFQEEGLNTTLPFGLEFVDDKRRNMFSKEVATAFMPFRTKEIFENGGLVYGLNEISNNLIVLNRKSYKNANAFVFGQPGGGKSMLIKQELYSVFLGRDNDEIIVLDPDGEYRRLIEALGGQIIRIASTSSDYINVLDLGEHYDKKDNPITLKCQFMEGFFDIIMNGNITAGQLSVADRCVANVLQKASSVNVPTLKTLYDELGKQKEPEAHDVALALEKYAVGSSSVFARKTNVDIHNRLVCFDVKDLAAQMHDLGMLVVIDEIDRRVARNRNRGVNTWLYFDEIWALFNFEKSAGYLRGAWKRFRKYGGLPTGISQNVAEIIANESTQSIVSNSEFIFMLEQSAEDKKELVRICNISEDQEQYITNNVAGHGLLYAGENLIPFNAEVDVKSEFYKLATTKIAEVSS